MIKSNLLQPGLGRAAIAAAILFAASAPLALAQTGSQRIQNLAPASAAPATLAPPDVSKSIRNIKPAALAIDRIDEVMLGALGIQLDVTKMEDVRRSAGGVIATKGDAGDAMRWLCYTVETGRRLWLTSEGAAGYPVNGLTVVAQPGVTGDASCPQLAAQLTPMGMIANIAIGDKREVAAGELGPAKATEWVRYEGCKPATVAGKPVRRCLDIVLRYSKNRVLTMQVRQKTTG